jgi:hypothetical protein
VSASPSISAPASTITAAVFAAVLTVCWFARGGSLAAVTVIVTVAVFESSVPSFTLKVKLSAPL